MAEITQGEIIAKWQEICQQPDTYGEGVISAVRLARWVERQTAPTLTAEVERLRASVGCAYCATVFKIDDPLQFDHWRECEKHPARLELERLQRENEAMRAALTPLAELWIDAMKNKPDHAPVYGLNDAVLTVGNIKAARAALGGE